MISNKEMIGALFVECDDDEKIYDLMTYIFMIMENCDKDSIIKWLHKEYEDPDKDTT